MTVSGTTTFSMTVAQIVTEARALLGVQAQEEPLQAVELEQGITALNLMLKTWQAEGVMAWTEAEGSFALAQGDIDYLIGAGGSFTTVPLDIIDARVTRGGIDGLMFAMDRADYYALPSKTTQGVPEYFYYDRQRSGGTFYVFPAPDVTPSTVNFTYRRIIMDAGNGTDTLDIPQEWQEAIIQNLAFRLIPYYSAITPEHVAVVTALAQASYAGMSEFGSTKPRGRAIRAGEIGKPIGKV